MRFTTILVAAASLAASATAAPGSFSSNPFSPIPGYPLGNGFCLSDAQANFLVNTFRSVLTNPDRQGANKTSQTLIADNYSEISDSINILAGQPLGGPAFNGKQGFIAGVVNAPALGDMPTLGIFHDCNNISWRWQIPNLGRNMYPVKGINDFTVSNVWTGQLTANYLEFNSIAWGSDIGWTCTPPPSH